MALPHPCPSAVPTPQFTPDNQTPHVRGRGRVWWPGLGELAPQRALQSPHNPQSQRTQHPQPGGEQRTDVTVTLKYPLYLPLLHPTLEELGGSSSKVAPPIRSPDITRKITTGQDKTNHDCRVRVLGAYHVPGTVLTEDLMYILLFKLHHNPLLFCLTINLILLMRKPRLRKVK